MNDDLLGNLIAAERAALVPRGGSQKATWAKVAHSVAVAATPATDPANVTSPAGAGGSTTPWAKGLLALALGAVALGGAAYGLRDDPPLPPAISQASVPAPLVEERASDPGPPRRDDGPSNPADRAAEIEAPSDEALPDPPALEPGSARSQKFRPRVGATSAESQDKPSTPPSELAEEARLLSAARAAIRRNEHGAALASLADHARRFPSGQLTEDRLTLVATAHCLDGDVAAGQRAADSLRRSFPASSHLARVGRVCSNATPR